MLDITYSLVPVYPGITIRKPIFSATIWCTGTAVLHLMLGLIPHIPSTVPM